MVVMLISENFADLAQWLPNHYYLTTHPLLTGMYWGEGCSADGHFRSVDRVVLAGLQWV